MSFLQLQHTGYPVDPDEAAAARAADLAYQRQVLEEGDDEEFDTVAANGVGAGSGSGSDATALHLGSMGSSQSGWDVRMPLSSEAAIRQHQMRLLNDEDDMFPLASPHSSNQLGMLGGLDMLGAGGRRRPPLSSPTASRCTPRTQLLFTLCSGCVLIMAVLILFVVFMTRNLAGGGGTRPPPNGNAFHMQFIGQSVLHFDLFADQSDPDGVWAPRVQEWARAWRRVLHPSHLVVSDLETALTGPYNGTNWRGNAFAHIAPPQTWSQLISLGINSWSCANNHAFDLGVGGLQNLIWAQGVFNNDTVCPGIGADRASAAGAALIPSRPTTTQGRPITLALLAVASGNVSDEAAASNTDSPALGVNRLRVSARGHVNAEDIAVQHAALSSAMVKGQGIDLVGVVHHTHIPPINSSMPAEFVDAWRVGVARGVIDGGAAFYLSHGQPFVQALELYKGRPVFYGLGNFVFQSRASAGTYAAQAYEGVVVDAEWGCVACRGPGVPVASSGPTTTETAEQREGEEGDGNEEGDEDEHGVESAGSLLRALKQRMSTRLAAAVPIFSGGDASDDEEGDAPPSAAASLAPAHLPLGVPSPSNPVSSAVCRCGYTLTSLLLRPLVLVRPDTPFANISTPLQFNNSFGLPSLDMDDTQARGVLQRIQRLSAEQFGTEMEIVDNIGEEQMEDDELEMRSTVFARVQLR